MIRTQVYLTEDLHQRIIRQAKIEGKPAAKVIRDALEDGLDNKTKKIMNSGQALLELAKIAVPGGDPNDSMNIDKILYEDI